MKSVLVTGSQGFIGSYVCNELLQNNYKVIGVDNFSKYGKVIRKHDKHKNFSLIEEDCSNPLVYEKLKNYEFDYIVAGTAMIGGISYFHKYAYDLLAMNERIISNTFDFALKQFSKKKLSLIWFLMKEMQMPQ